MGFGYAGTFLIIFLTHPGVIIPTMSSVTSLLPAETAIPTDGFPPVLSGLWQTLWAWILSIPGERSQSLAWTMYTLYLIFLAGYMYLFLRIRMEKGV